MYESRDSDSSYFLYHVSTSFQSVMLGCVVFVALIVAAIQSGKSSDVSVSRRNRSHQRCWLLVLNAGCRSWLV